MQRYIDEVLRTTTNFQSKRSGPRAYHYNVLAGCFVLVYVKGEGSPLERSLSLPNRVHRLLSQSGKNPDYELLFQCGKTWTRGCTETGDLPLEKAIESDLRGN